MRLLAILVAVATLSLAADSAQAAPVVQIVEITCFPGHSLDTIHLKNTGDAPQNLTGWQARSDPETTQRMDLGFIGALAAGGDLYLVAGQHSATLPLENQYRWSIGEVLRDDDPYDYARVLDAAGNQVTGMTCAGGPVDLTVPTPVPTPKPAPTPTPVPGTPAPTAPPAPEVIGPQPPSAVRGQTNQPRTITNDSAPANPVTGTVDTSVPAGGGRPLSEQDDAKFLVALGLTAMIGGATLIAKGRSPKRGSGAGRE